MMKFSFASPSDWHSVWLKNRASWLGGLLFAFVPALGVLLLVHEYGVDIPVWDDWERARILDLADQGRLGWSTLSEPHIEHRVVVQRLVMLANAKFGGGNLRHEMFVVAGISILMSVGAFFLLRRTLRPGSGLRYPLAFLLNLMLLSALQWQNYLWAVQVAIVIPSCAAVWALVVLGSTHLKLWLRFLLCLALALLAVLGFGHGVLLWPLILCAVLLTKTWATGRGRWIFASLWSLAAGLVSWWYYQPSTFKTGSHSAHSYNQNTGEVPPSIAHLGEVFDRPEKILDFFAAGLGNQFVRWPEVATVGNAIGIGWTMLALLGLVALCWMIRIRDHGAWDRLLPWFALAGMSVAGSAMLAVSRCGVAGLDRALSPRYIAITVFAGAALVIIAVVLVRDWGERRGAAWPNRLRSVFMVFAGLFTAVQAVYWTTGFSRAEIHHDARLHTRAGVAFIQEFTPDVMPRLDASVDLVREAATVLDRLGQLGVPLVEGRELSQFRMYSTGLAQSRAAFEELVQTGDGSWHASGYAKLPGGAPADGVLLVCINEEGEREIFALADVRPWIGARSELMGPDHEFDGIRGHEKRLPTVRWDKDFAIEDLPVPVDGPVEIEAWAFDERNRKVRRMVGTFSVE